MGQIFLPTQFERNYCRCEHSSSKLKKILLTQIEDNLYMSRLGCVTWVDCYAVAMAGIGFNFFFFFNENIIKILATKKF